MTKLNNIINEELVTLDVDVNSQEEALNYAINDLFEKGYILDRNQFSIAVNTREKEVSTAVGHQIAVPHGKSNIVKKPFIYLMRTQNLINWGDEKIKIIFLIGVPKESKGQVHLKLISGISKKIIKKEFREKLLISDKNDILKRIIRF